MNPLLKAMKQKNSDTDDIVSADTGADYSIMYEGLADHLKKVKTP